MSNSKEYNFASWKKKEPEIIKTYDTSNPPEYKLHLQYPKGWRYLMYKPHTSELTENGIPVSLESINMDYTKGHFHEWIPNSPSNPAKKSDKPNNVKIQMGLKCNYSCSYCNQAQFVPNSFQGNPAEAQKFLDELDTWFKGDGNKTRWEFWGGEPLVYIKVLKVLAEGLRKKFPKAEFNIITNASMLTPEIVDWLDSLDFQVGISHDGAVYRDQRGEDILCKPETLAAVKYAYNKLFPKGRIGFNCVLTVKNYSLHKVREYIAEKMGLEPFNIPLTTEEIMLPYDAGGMMLSPTLPEEQKEMKEVLFEEAAFGKTLGVSTVFDKLDDFFNSISTRRPFTVFGQKCGMDNPNILAVDLKGNTMTCQNVNANLPNHNTGTYKDIKAIEMTLVHHFRTRSECVRCPVVQLCKGACLFLENEYWTKACDVSYNYNVAMLGAALYRLTGGVLRYIEGTPRRDNMNDKIEIISQDFIDRLMKKPEEIMNY
jgi:uncharacterized protein